MSILLEWLRVNFYGSPVETAVKYNFHLYSQKFSPVFADNFSCENCYLRPSQAFLSELVLQRRSANTKLSFSMIMLQFLHICSVLLPFFKLSFCTYTVNWIKDHVYRRSDCELCISILHHSHFNNTQKPFIEKEISVPEVCT